MFSLSHCRRPNPVALFALLCATASCAHGASGKQGASGEHRSPQPGEGGPACESGATSSPSVRCSASRAAHYPGTLRSPSELGADFQWRQRVTARWPKGEHTFDAVLTKDDNQLMLLGLGPMDTPGFILTLNAEGDVAVENRTGKPIPFDARYILLDVQRTFYPWFQATISSGSRTASVDGEQITEQWKQGTLLRRTFVRTDSKPPGEITVTYHGWTPGNRAPMQARLTNGWFGYVLDIHTISQQTL